MGLKRGHKPPTAKPKIRPVPKRRPALLAACARPVAKMVSRKTVAKVPEAEVNVGASSSTRHLVLVIVQPYYGADPDTIAFFGLCFRIDGREQT
jgi:hypothetical protein